MEQQHSTVSVKEHDESFLDEVWLLFSSFVAGIAGCCLCCPFGDWSM